MSHSFTANILAILEQHFGINSQAIFEASPLLQYLNIKTRSANRGSKARGAFANHYALYVLIEDYVKQGFVDVRQSQYQYYAGARYSDLLERQRQLPFGAKLQNHALNARLNDEFAKYFPTLELVPILRDQQEQRYWINEKLLLVEADGQIFNIAEVVLRIIEAYSEAKQSAFNTFLATCKQLATLSDHSTEQAIAFIREQLTPNVDARIFEIVSFAILRAYYSEITIFWGWTRDDIQQAYLTLYKTGRTNANDGGIDFVMRPVGRFFQVTETIHVRKYFLDIDKIQHFPLSFVVKSTASPEDILAQLRNQAQQYYGVAHIIEKYMSAIEEIITLPRLLALLENLIETGHLPNILSEIVHQSQVEFNFTHFDD